MPRSSQWIRGALLLCACACATPTASSSKGASVRALEFSLPDLAGANVQPSDYLGQVVLVDFWATWCKPCEASFEAYEAFLEQYRDQGFVVLAVSVDAQDEDVERYVKRRGLSFHILRDPEGAVPESLALSTMPTALLVGRDGRVRYVHEGFRDGDAALLEEKIRAALAEAAPGSAPGDRPKASTP